MNLVGAKVLYGVAPMADTLRQVAQLCPSVRKVILYGERHDGFVSYQDMMQDGGDLFNDNLEVIVLFYSFLNWQNFIFGILVQN